VKQHQPVGDSLAASVIRSASLLPGVPMASRRIHAKFMMPYLSRRGP
jgi:hypothetical protein